MKKNIMYRREFTDRYMEQLAEMGFPAASQAEAKRSIKAFINTVEYGLINKETISLNGFGKFEIRHRKAKIGRNLQTNEQIQIPASDTVGFKPSKLLRDKLNDTDI